MVNLIEDHGSETMSAKSAKNEPKAYAVYTRTEDGIMTSHRVIQSYTDMGTVVLVIADPK